MPRLTGLADLQKLLEAMVDLRRAQTHHHLSYTWSLLQVRKELIRGGKKTIITHFQEEVFWGMTQKISEVLVMLFFFFFRV